MTLGNTDIQTENISMVVSLLERVIIHSTNTFDYLLPPTLYGRGKCVYSQQHHQKVIIIQPLHNLSKSRKKLASSLSGQFLMEKCKILLKRNKVSDALKYIKILLILYMLTPKCQLSIIIQVRFIYEKNDIRELSVKDSTTQGKTFSPNIKWSSPYKMLKSGFNQRARIISTGREVAPATSWKGILLQFLSPKVTLGHILSLKIENWIIYPCELFSVPLWNSIE